MKSWSSRDAKFAVVAVCLGALSLPVLLAPSAAEAGNKRRPLVTVQLKNGERFTLRDFDFLIRGQGERPRGSKPPGTPTGPIPGTAPGGYPGEGGGTTKRDPRQPTHNLAGSRRRSEPNLGITERDLYLLRRLDIVRIEKGITYADYTYKNGEFRPNKPMLWNALSGWEHPGKEGKFYFFEAEEILYLEFPEY